MSRWAFWRKRPANAQGPEANASPPRRVAIWLEPEALGGVLSWMLPGSAVVVGFLGQMVLAAVLLLVACGVWLRLWRTRRWLRKGAAKPPGRYL